MSSLRLHHLLSCALVVAALNGCDDEPPPAPAYFDRVIQPILTQNCAFNQGACHKDDGNGNAVGNLDVTSYAQITKRRDVLRTYGSFPVPLLLMKASGEAVPPIPYNGSTSGQPVYLPVEIKHVGSNTLSVDSNAFFELQKWMANGANEDGAISPPAVKQGTGPCNPDFMTVRPDVVAKLSTVDTSQQAFKDFASKVEPILGMNCAVGTCHSSEQSDFFLTCQGSGSDDATKFNYLEASAFIGNPVDQSPIVLKPLAPSAGGVAHGGGVFFDDKTNTSWTSIHDWVVTNGPPQILTNLTDGQKFFYDNVMPIFLKRGCALEGCHSPGAANDFKLRAGNQGFLSAFSLDANYRVARYDFLMPEFPDVRQSRIAKKPVRTIAEGGYGIVHRGGPPLETDGDTTDPAMCPQPWSIASSAFCTMVEWHRIERVALLAANGADPMAQGSALPIIAVTRPPNNDRAIDFDTYRPGADLVELDAPLGALGAPDVAAATSQSLLANCAGSTATRDVRGPDVSYDGSKVAFAMRTSMTDTLDIYEVTLDPAHTCTKVTDGNGMATNGVLHHNLDPMYSPDGTLVFASSRAGLRSLKYLLPQTDLWRMPKTATGFGTPEQMTALLGSELNPQMMLNGQLSFTAEKATQDFYQLSGRRMNWDLTDYHPLIAQRASSPSRDTSGQEGMPEPSIDYQQATEIRELPDRNFVFILSDDGTKGMGGTLASFNRSVGPFQANRTDTFFLKGVTMFDPAATGRAGGTTGAYRSPFGLPDGRILVSYAPAVTNLGSASDADMRYDLVAFDPRDGTRTNVGGLNAGLSTVEAVVAFKRDPRVLFRNITQLVFGGHVDTSDPTHGEIHFPDLPLLGTILIANLRTGRFVDTFDPATQLVVYQAQPPPADLSAAMAGQIGSQKVYDVRTKLGSAPLQSDHSVHVRIPALTPLIYELQDGSGKALMTMSEEDQVGPGERISRGVPRTFYNSVCGGCHGSISGQELDIAVNPDALTGASVSLSRGEDQVVTVGP